MTTKERNALARASKGKMAGIQAANRAAHAEQRDRTRAQQNRHTAAEPIAAATGPRTKRKRRNYAGSQTDGYRSVWTISPYYSNLVTVDSRWSATVSG